MGHPQIVVVVVAAVVALGVVGVAVAEEQGSAVVDARWEMLKEAAVVVAVVVAGLKAE